MWWTLSYFRISRAETCSELVYRIQKNLVIDSSCRIETAKPNESGPRNLSRQSKSLAIGWNRPIGTTALGLRRYVSEQGGRFFGVFL